MQVYQVKRAQAPWMKSALELLLIARIIARGKLLLAGELTAHKRSAVSNHLHHGPIAAITPPTNWLLPCPFPKMSNPPSHLLATRISNSNN